MNIKYDLNVDPKKGESQYNDYDLEKNRIVPARYVPALLESYRGNIFIEALPPPRMKEDICNEYFKPLPNSDVVEKRILTQSYNAKDWVRIKIKDKVFKVRKMD